MPDLLMRCALLVSESVCCCSHSSFTATPLPLPAHSCRKAATAGIASVSFSEITTPGVGEYHDRDLISPKLISFPFPFVSHSYFRYSSVSRQHP